MSALAGFHPIIEHWFHDQVGQPTDAQEQSWQRVSAGEHVLITAPTGSGKTFAAFLWAINQLVTGDFSTGHTSVLYVSPLISWLIAHRKAAKVLPLPVGAVIRTCSPAETRCQLCSWASVGWPTWS